MQIITDTMSAYKMNGKIKLTKKGKHVIVDKDEIIQWWYATFWNTQI